MRRVRKQVGEYVDYTPVSGSFTSQGTYNGSSNIKFFNNNKIKMENNVCR